MLKCKKYILFFLITAFHSSFLLAGETGKIAGKVVDKQTGEALPGANVIVTSVWSGDREMKLDNPFGAASDVNGEYFIINVPPGSYSVQVSFIGYKGEKRTRVRVQVDKTTRLDFELQPISIAGEEVVVTAYKPNTVEVDLTATKQTYQIEDIESIAGVADITDILELQADVVDDHFRGGRVGEALYMIAGANIVNPLNNQRAFRPIVTGLQEVEVYTSGFSAEYGNAQSGVINMITKEGKDKWETRVELSTTAPYYKTWGGSVYSPDNLMFFDALNDPEEWLKENPTQPGKPLWDMGYGAPVYLPPRVEWPPNPLTHQDSVLMGNIGRKAWLVSFRDIGMEYDNVPDYRLDFTTGGPISKNARVFLAARQTMVQPRVPTPQNDAERQIMSNLVYTPNSNNKVKFTFIFDNQFSNVLGSNWLRYMFDRTLSVPKLASTTKQYGVEWKHVFSPSSFMDWKFKTLDILTERRIELLREDQFTEDYSSHRNWVSFTAPHRHETGKIADDRGDQRTLSYNLNGSLTSQVNHNNLLKAGLQFTYYHVDVDMDMNASNVGSYRNVSFLAFPYEGALYFQDKMEFQGLIANIGFRFDFYNLNAEYYADEFSPLRNPYYDPTLPYLERGKYYDPQLAKKEKTKLYTRLQPRIGISFPVSDRSVFHLNYGTFTQRPNFNQIFYSQVTMFNEIEVLGNPRLKPENTKAYDVGLVQGMPYGFYLDVSAYYKDVTDLVETAYFFDEQQTVYRTYRNRDYADIKGFHVNLEKKTGFLRGYVRYNYESAKGKSSNDLDAPVTYFEKPAEGQEPIELPDPEDIYLDYDRTHKMVFNLRFRTAKDFGPEVIGVNPLADLSFSTTMRVMSGRPYTWDETGRGLKFNKRTPWEKNLKLRVEKRIRIAKNIITVYGEAFNILNDKVFYYSRVFRNDRNVVKWEKDREHIEIYTEYPPYFTSQRIYIFNNQPRHYRFGLIVNF